MFLEILSWNELGKRKKKSLTTNGIFSRFRKFQATLKNRVFNKKRSRNKFLKIKKLEYDEFLMKNRCNINQRLDIFHEMSKFKKKEEIFCHQFQLEIILQNFQLWKFFIKILQNSSSKEAKKPFKKISKRNHPTSQNISQCLPRRFD